MSQPKTENSKLSGLYAIADAELLGNKLERAVDDCLRGGAELVQLRDKINLSGKKSDLARNILGLCRKYSALLIVNDDVELAKNIGADGVHLGRHDMPLVQARDKLGDGAIIGVSCYNQLQLAIKAERDGANYIAFGSVFPSPTKPRAVHAPINLISMARQTLNLPICAIGGINEENMAYVVRAGADMAAVLSALFISTDIRQKTRLLVEIAEQNNPKTL